MFDNDTHTQRHANKGAQQIAVAACEEDKSLNCEYLSVGVIAKVNSVFVFYLNNSKKLF